LILLLQLDRRSGLDLLRLGCGRGRHGAGLAVWFASPWLHRSLLSSAQLAVLWFFGDSRSLNERQECARASRFEVLGSGRVTRVEASRASATWFAALGDGRLCGFASPNGYVALAEALVELISVVLKGSSVSRDAVVEAPRSMQGVGALGLGRSHDPSGMLAVSQG
jgi:hypothetical protein